VSAGEDDGVPVSVPDTLVAVETSSEIAPEPCTQEFPGSPFWLGLDGPTRYPSTVAAASGAAQEATDDAEAARDAEVRAAQLAEALRRAAQDAAVEAAATAEAAELFVRTDTCTTALAGMDVVVEFPAAWWTNRDAPEGHVPCLWYAQTPFEVAGAEERPAGVAITLGAVGGPPGESSRSADVVTEDVTVAGRPALRVEEREVDEGGNDRRVTYWISVGPSADGGPTLVATTSSADAGSYELNAAVLDEMMRRLEIRGPEAP